MCTLHLVLCVVKLVHTEWFCSIYLSNANKNWSSFCQKNEQCRAILLFVTSKLRELTCSFLMLSCGNQTPLATSSSCQLPLGMEIQILFANIGALVNPQAKIIGVSFVYDTLRTVQIRVGIVLFFGVFFLQGLSALECLLLIFHIINSYSWLRLHKINSYSNNIIN